MKHATAGSPYQLPPEPKRWSAIVLAVVVHALLLAFLVIGIRWQNNKPDAVEAEVWDMKIQTAAPPPPTPQEVEPQPAPEPEPAPAPKVVEQPAPPAPAPDIKLEQEKKRKEELRQKELAEQKKREELKQRELDKKEADRKAKEEAARKEAEDKAKELAREKEAEKKAAAEKLKAEKAAKARLARLKEQMHAQDMDRMMAQAGAGTSGSAAKSTAPRLDSGYVAALKAKIKSNTTYPGSTDVPGNPEVSFRVEQLPTGEILSVTKVKSSGVAVFDDAVERGIHKSTPLPRKKDGTVERTLMVVFSMKDLN